MPGFVAHLGATVLCSHGGQAQPVAPNPRVLVSGQPVTTIAAPYSVAGCPFNVSGVPVPCVIGLWTSGSTRVLATGQPLVLLSSTSVTVLNGTPLIISATQTRVSAI